MVRWRRKIIIIFNNEEAYIPLADDAVVVLALRAMFKFTSEGERSAFHSYSPSLQQADISLFLFTFFDR